MDKESKIQCCKLNFQRFEYGVNTQYYVTPTGHCKVRTFETGKGWSKGKAIPRTEYVEVWEKLLKCFGIK